MKTGCVFSDYYKMRILYSEMPIRNGVIEGVTKHYYEYGNLRFGISIKNGEINGIRKHHYESGDIHAEIPYTNSKINGIVKFYNREENLLWRANTQNGKLTSGKCPSVKHSQIHTLQD